MRLKSISGIIVFAFSFVTLLMLPGCSKPAAVADTVFVGKIWTGNPSHPLAEAFAVSADTILAVGSETDIKPYIGKTTTVVRAANGQLVVPGFIDNHQHFIDGGYTLSSVQLRDAKTPKELIERVKAFAKTVKPGTWIIGGNWDHQEWGGELPEKNWIDSVTKDNPVWINRSDGHMCLANSVALKIAGVTDATKDIAGGSVIRKNGHVTGMFKDNAKQLVQNAMPEPAQELREKALESAMQYVASHGITSIVGMIGTTDAENYDLYQQFHDQHKLITRIYATTALKDWKSLHERVQKNGKGDEWFKIGALKGFVDGSLGSHTAAFMKPFTDAPKDSGLMVTERDPLYHRVKSADSVGLQVFVHAIGDRSVHTLLDVFEQVEKENGPRDRRFRMEHAQHIDPLDYPRFAQLNVIPSMQPYHAIDDGRWAEKFIGHERARNTYAFKSLVEAKAKLAFGSDWFVAPAPPLLGIYAAATRRTLDGKNPEGWIPEQKISVQQALQAYTLDGAYAIFEENKRGSLEPGKLADFVILDQDITAINPAEIEHVHVLNTYVGGKVVYEKKK